MQPPQHPPPTSASRSRVRASTTAVPAGASFDEPATVARPHGEAPLPGAHLGEVGRALARLRAPAAGIKLGAVAIGVVYVELPLVVWVLFAWTRAHPGRHHGRGWRWLTRLLSLPAAWAIWLLLWGFWIGDAVLGLPATGPNVALRHGLSIGCTLVWLLAMEGVWRTHRRLLRGGRALQKLRRTVQISRARVVLAIGFAIALGAVALLQGPAAATELFGFAITMEVLTGLWLKGTFLQASRALALRYIPDAADAEPIRGQDALLRQTGLALESVAGVWTARGMVDGRPVQVAVDPATDPALLGVTVAVDGLAAFAPGLELRGRTATDPEGIPLADPILGGLVVAECDSPDGVRPLLGQLHGPLLAVLQGWPGSRVVDGKVHLKGTIDLGTGDERVGPRRGIDAATADAIALARALEAAIPPAG